MGAGCCGNEARFDGVSTAYRGVLWAVIAINATMFVVEMTAGIAAQSQALRPIALDFLGDTANLCDEPRVIGMSLRVGRRRPWFKGISLSLMAAWVLGSTL